MNSAYYAGFNLENRYYNFAINLGTGAGAGAAAFATKYGALTFDQAVSTAYDTIIGIANVSNASTAIASITASKAFFTAVASERAPGGASDINVKALMVGYILEEGNKAHVGAFAQVDDAYLADLASGHLVFAVDLVGAYHSAIHHT